jgi:hypothetical protein
VLDFISAVSLLFFCLTCRPALVRFTESLGVGFAIWIEEVLAALLQFSLSAVLRTETSAAEDENHRMWPLQFRRAYTVSRYGRKIHSRERRPREPCQLA